MRSVPPILDLHGAEPTGWVDKSDPEKPLTYSPSTVIKEDSPYVLKQAPPKVHTEEDGFVPLDWENNPYEMTHKSIELDTDIEPIPSIKEEIAIKIAEAMAKDLDKSLFGLSDAAKKGATIVTKFGKVIGLKSKKELEDAGLSPYVAVDLGGTDSGETVVLTEPISIGYSNMDSDIDLTIEHPLRIKEGTGIVHDGDFFQWPNCKPPESEGAEGFRTEFADAIFTAMYMSRGEGEGYWECIRDGYGAEDDYGNGPVYVTGIGGVIVI